jgi:hypothetical protein
VPAPPSGAEARRTTRPLHEIRIALA